MSTRFNPWKFSTLALGVALLCALAGPLSSAEAAGPVRLGKALAALKSGKKLLEEAKDPPAPQHAQSMTAVTQAIAAVEREIKAYEVAAAKAKGATSAAASAAPSPPRKKDDKPRTEPKKPAAPVED